MALPDLSPVGAYRVRLTLGDPAHACPVRAHHEDVVVVEGGSAQLVAGEDDPATVRRVRREGSATSAGDVREPAQVRPVGAHGEHVTGRSATVAAEYQVRTVR